MVVNCLDPGTAKPALVKRRDSIHAVMAEQSIVMAPPRKLKHSVEGTERPLVGRDAFAKISAVEGIVLSEEAKEALADFDRRKLTAAERRRAIVEKFKREPRK
jgi:hypothetical protein